MQVRLLNQQSSYRLRPSPGHRRSISLFDIFCVLESDGPWQLVEGQILHQSANMPDSFDWIFGNVDIHVDSWVLGSHAEMALIYTEHSGRTDADDSEHSILCDVQERNV